MAPSMPAGSSPLASVLNEAMDASQETDPEATEEDPDFHGELAKNQRRVIKSKLLDPVRITFREQDELLRGQANKLPQLFYRTFYETSATLSKYVSIDTHVKHRKRKTLVIQDGMAFQPVARFTVHDYLHREGIERHLVWNQKKDPSGYVSVFDDLSHAKRRAGFHYDESQRIGQRVSIACINTDGLIPATVHAKCESKICILTKEPGSKELEKSKMIWRDVDIPFWIHRKAREQYGDTITPDQLEESGADMCISITEIRLCNLKEEGPFGSVRRDSICAKGHDYEWLFCGPIYDSRTVDVWPWDGSRLYMNGSRRPIRSFENSGQPWVWEKTKKMWVPDWVQKPLASDEAQDNSNKRKNDQDQHDEDKHDKRKRKCCKTCGCTKKRPLLSISAIMSTQTLPQPLVHGTMA
ncbi:unnamed protein product [Alternaria alternata]